MARGKSTEAKVPRESHAPGLRFPAPDTFQLKPGVGAGEGRE